MANFRNVLVVNRTALINDTVIHAGVVNVEITNLDSWLTYVMAQTRDISTGDHHIPSSSPVAYHPAYLLHKWVKLGQLGYKYGLEHFEHYVEMPIAWASEIHHTEEIPGELPEDPPIEIEVTNKAYFYRKWRENDTNCIAWMNEDTYTELNGLITFDAESNPTNMIVEQDYYNSIIEGGDYYIEPEEPEEPV